VAVEVWLPSTRGHALTARMQQNCDESASADDLPFDIAVRQNNTPDEHEPGCVSRDAFEKGVNGLDNPDLSTEVPYQDGLVGTEEGFAGREQTLRRRRSY
jgi:hypothetical protein